MDTSNVDTVMIGGKINRLKGKLAGLNMTLLKTMDEQSRNYVVSGSGWPTEREFE